jgi:hypothetical protein
MESRINYRKLANIVMIAGAILMAVAVCNWYVAVNAITTGAPIRFFANGPVFTPPPMTDYLSSLYTLDGMLPGYNPALLYFGVFVFVIGLVLRLALTKRPAQA